jgi:hypothetical protein
MHTVLVVKSSFTQINQLEANPQPCKLLMEAPLVKLAAAAKQRSFNPWLRLGFRLMQPSLLHRAPTIHNFQFYILCKCVTTIISSSLYRCQLQSGCQVLITIHIQGTLCRISISFCCTHCICGEPVTNNHKDQ